MQPERAQRPELRQRYRVETPEQVGIDYEIAGLGSRAAAATIDLLLLGGTGIAGAVVFLTLRSRGLVPGGVAPALLIMIAFTLWYGYFTFFEGLRGGQTPGKRFLGIRVVADTGHPAGLGAAAIRNLLRAADFLPPPYLLGMALIALHPRAKRIGDLVAGTIVVRDRPQEELATAAPVAGMDLLAPELTDEEFRIVGEFVARAGELGADARARLASGLASRLADPLSRMPDAGGDLLGALATLHASESARRQGRLGARHGAAEQLAARQGPRWEEFRALADRVSRQGLDSLSPHELPDFAARYREIAADLARLRTYRADRRTLERVERLAAAGHNALYREADRGLGRIWSAIAREFPAAVVDARGYVLVAFIAFAIPAGVGYLALRERPEIAAEVLPDAMLERADAGASRSAAGGRFVEAHAAGRPIIASGIIANNVRVAFYCFAGGAFLGVGSLVLLAFNGLQIGAAAGHFANVGLLGYLLEFIAGHGAIELFAIWVAGAAGLLLGRAIVAPGELTRGDALVVAGRRAVRMVGAAVVCLVVAGLIEGFVSTSGAGWGGRALASGASLGFLAVYLVGGVLGKVTERRKDGKSELAARERAPC